MSKKNKMKTKITEEVAQKVFNLKKEGLSTKVIAGVLGIGKSTAEGLIRTGSVQGYRDQFRNARSKKNPTGYKANKTLRKGGVTEHQFNLVKTLSENGLSCYKISKILGYSTSTVNGLSKASSLDGYHETNRLRLAKYKTKKTNLASPEVVGAPEVHKAGDLKPVKSSEGAVVTLSLDQWNTLITKLNAMHYDIAAIKGKKGLVW